VWIFRNKFSSVHIAPFPLVLLQLYERGVYGLMFALSQRGCEALITLKNQRGNFLCGQVHKLFFVEKVSRFFLKKTISLTPPNVLPYIYNKHFLSFSQKTTVNSFEKKNTINFSIRNEFCTTLIVDFQEATYERTDKEFFFLFS